MSLSRTSHNLVSAAVLFIITLSSRGEQGPRIGCKEPEYLFGELSNTGTVEHGFLIQNLGDAPLAIGKVKSCCGATAEISAQIISPGSNATLQIIFPLKGRKGDQKKSFYVGSNDRTQPYFQVRLTGTAKADAFIEPEDVNFGNLGPNDEREQTLRLVCLPAVSLSITNIAINAPWFKSEYERTKDGYCIRIRTVPPLKPGVLHGSMCILTDNTRYPMFNAHLTATLTSDIQVVPKEISLVAATGRVDTITRYLAVRSRRGVPFTVLGVEPPESGIETKVLSLKPSIYRCEISNILPFPELDGKELIIRTDHEEGREIRVPIRITPTIERGRASGR
ncbi:MAG: DUF1573 domain-containing protein [bacterium]